VQDQDGTWKIWSRNGNILVQQTSASCLYLFAQKETTLTHSPANTLDALNANRYIKYVSLKKITTPRGEKGFNDKMSSNKREVFRLWNSGVVSRRAALP
jgi:hypothetical protein